MLTRRRSKLLSAQSLESLTISEPAPAKKIRLRNVTNVKNENQNLNKNKTEKGVDKNSQSLSGEMEVSQKTQTSSLNAIEEMKCIKRVLDESSKNVVHRLSIDSVPNCLYDLKKCSRIHSTKNQQQRQLTPNNISKHFLDEQNYTQFISYARDCIFSRNDFPGVGLIRKILEAIMNIPSNLDENMKCKTISSLYHIVCVILEKFPTCQWREYYRHLLLDSMEICKMKTENCEFGVVHAMLDLLNDLIYQKNDWGIASKMMSKRKVLNRKNTIYLWATAAAVATKDEEDEELSFINFPRDEKFERIFLILDVLTRVLEHDLAMFTIKYAGMLSTNITHPRHRPIICSVIWREYDSIAVINETVKNLISIYCDMIVMKYPKAKVRIIARLLNLICQVVNLFECPDESVFPFHGKFTASLVYELYKRLEDSNFKSSSSSSSSSNESFFYVDAVENLRSPLIKMLLASEILQNLHKSSSYSSQPISLSIPMNLIQKKEFLKFNSSSKTKKKKTILSQSLQPEGEMMMMVESNKVEKGMSDEKYPALSQTRRAIKAEITEDCYLKLLLLFSSSINHFYRIVLSYKEVQKCYVTTTTSTTSPEIIKIESSSSSSLMKDEKYSSNEDFVVDLNEKVCMRKVDLRFKKLDPIKLTMETCSFYRNEMKHLLLLTKLIKKCHDKYGAKFGDWMKFVESVENET